MIWGYDSLPNGQPVLSQIREATPDFTAGFANDLTYKAVRLYLLWHWQQHGGVINFTRLTYDLAQQTSEASSQATDHFLGVELCQRCHQTEAAQWKTTAHSLAWQTLVTVKKDATPECIGCHVVGYKAPGGFQSSADAPRLVNVQCENCHGMGTRHEEYSTTLKITAQTCQTCHHGDNDPEFNWDKKLPMIAHGNMSGETIQRMKNKPPNPAMMKGGSN